MTQDFGISQGDGTRLAVLDRLIAKLAVGASKLKVLEVGSYEGRSALAFSASIVQYCEHGGTVVCVDPWKPYLPEEDVQSNDTCRLMEADLKAGTVFNRFVSNTKQADQKAPISFYVGTLSGALPLLSGEQFDLVYIDGSHAYADVFNDISAAKTLVKVGGILCGDDLERQLNQCDPDRVEKISHREYADGFHPGVTLAVWRAFGRVWCEEGVWAMQKGVDHKWSSP